jgi:ACDE family multidrug resistance protein
MFAVSEDAMNTMSAKSSPSISRGHPKLLFATLMLGMMAQGLVLTAFVSALPQMAHDLGNRGQFLAQMTMALAALGLMIGALVSGSILSTLGTRVTLIVSALLYGLCGAGGLFFRAPALLLAACFIIGFTAACMVTTCVWGIAAEYEGSQRAKVLGWSSALSNIAALTGTVLGGHLAQFGGWPLAFSQFPAFGLIAIVLTLFSIRQVKPERDQPEKIGRPHVKRLMPFYLLTVLLFAVIFMGSTPLVFLLEEDGIRDPATRSLIIGTLTVVGTMAAFCYGPSQQKLGTLETFTLALVSAAIGLVALGSSAKPDYAIFGIGLMGIYVGLVVPYLYHAVTERTDAYSRSHAIGLLSAFAFLGAFLNPPILAALSNAIGLRNVYLLVALVMGLAASGTAFNLIRLRQSLRKPLGSR